MLGTDQAGEGANNTVRGRHAQVKAKLNWDTGCGKAHENDGHVAFMLMDDGSQMVRQCRTVERCVESRVNKFPTVTVRCNNRHNIDIV